MKANKAKKKTTKKKDETVNTRMERYRKTTVTVTVSVEAAAQLDKLAEAAGVAKRRDMLELLIEHASLPAPSTIEALKLLKECGGNHTEAMKLYTYRNKEEPGRYPKKVKDALCNLNRKPDKP